MFGWWDICALFWQNFHHTKVLEQYKGGLKLLEGVTSDSLIVGLRRSVKAIEKGEAAKAIVATDIAPGIFDDFTMLCIRNDIPFDTVESKSAFCKSCRIDVDASVVVVKKQK